MKSVKEQKKKLEKKKNRLAAEETRLKLKVPLELRNLYKKEKMQKIKLTE